jgi:hypothetical protein
MFDRKPRHATLAQVASALVKRWCSSIAGDYEAPPCPPVTTLRRLLTALNYASGVPEEGRFPRFSVVVAKADQPTEGVWRFERPRAFELSELRRMLPVTDVDKSALLVEFDDDGLSIAGLVDMGTSWRRARIGLAYHYNAPPHMIVEVERPNRFSVYQGQFRVATFADGLLDMPFGLDLPLFLHDIVNAGIDEDLSPRLVRPRREPPKEFCSFEFTALWNCFAAIANSIAHASHGGTLVILPGATVDEKLAQVKYGLRSSRLADAFVKFMNARHRSADRYFDQDMGKRVAAGELAQLDRAWLLAFEEVVEAVRFIARLAQCDGAVLLTRGLELVGFGCELKATMAPGRQAVTKSRNWGGEEVPLDVEQFGMRHRSAVKYISQCPNAVALVISQDGPISGVWSKKKDGDIAVRTEPRLISMHLPWS